MGSALQNKAKRLKALSLSEPSMNIDEMIHLASRKLYPIIEMLVDGTNKSEHLLTTQEFNDAAAAADIIKEICQVLVRADFKLSTKNTDFAFDKHKTTINDQGKIYVETGLLLQLIDLYNTLEDAKDTVDEFYRSIGINSLVQTESATSSVFSEGPHNPNRIVLTLTKPLTKSNSSLGFLSKNFIVMPSETDDEIRESKSAISTSFGAEATRSPIQKAKSTSSFVNEELLEITDVYGAKRVVVRCIYDLQEVGKYLGTERKDVATICSRVEVDTTAFGTVPNNSTRRSNQSAKFRGDKSNQDETTLPVSQEGDESCCCPKCFAEFGSKTDLQECDDDKVIICIKGCDENEGDVQIVIRQCPDCKKAEEIPTTRSNTSVRSETKRLKSVPSNKNYQSISGNENDGKSVPSNKNYQSISGNENDRKSVLSNKNYQSISGNENDRKSVLSNKNYQSISKSAQQTLLKSAASTHSNAETASLHNKDSRESLVCSDEGEEDDRGPQKSSFLLNKKSASSLKKTPSNYDKTIDPRFSNARAPVANASVMSQRKSELKQGNVQQQSRAECSKIRMFETTNLCLETDTGQELVISVTVTPREFDNKKLSLRDIFSEDEYAHQAHVSYKPESSPYQAKYKPRTSTDSSGSKRSVSLREPSQSSMYYLEDKVIPLGRTKVCSSVDFNVTTLQTRLRDKGIEHNNAKIVVQLQDLGIDNLLRACRPAKCCRKAVLNEKMKKCLPYPPSLRSLPLDEGDMEVINQSLQMSVQKVKNSTNLNKDFYANYSYSIKPVQTIMYFFVKHSNDNLNTGRKTDGVTEKLSYYINLVNDLKFETKSSKFDILYFGVEGPSNKTLSEEVRKNSDKVNQNIFNKNIMDVKTNAVTPDISKSLKEKYQKYEERPMVTGYTNTDQSSSFFINHNLTKKQCKMENNHQQVHAKFEKSNMLKVKSQKATNISKIPIYVGSNRTKYLNPENNNYNVEEIEKEIYGISLDSLPRKSSLLQEDNLFTGSKISSVNKEKPNEKEKSHHKTIIDQIEDISSSKSSGPSKYSLISNFIVRKPKRKKKEFYLSRSKSELSLKTLKNNKYKRKAISTQTKDLSKKKLNNKHKSVENNEASSASNGMLKQDSSTIRFNYFSKMLYKMIVRETLNENILDSMMRHKKYQKSCTETTENKSLCELYKRLSPKNIARVQNFGINYSDVESTHHDLKAKKSQSCIVIASRASKKNGCIIENLAIQTSVLFAADNKHCQTSNSLLAYLVQPTFKHEDNTYIQKKRIFKKMYNDEALTGIQNSCDQLEKFIVIFRSDHSLKSNVSDNLDFLSSASEHSDRSLENVSQQTINNSLDKLKKTLEKYESVKHEIAQGALQAGNINPIEYFVYQMCACGNKVNKKPSVMQKILSKSKGLFSSLEKDICIKYRNQRNFFSMSSEDRQQCHQCGCYISQCTGHEPTGENLDNQSKSPCQCLPNSKAKKPPTQPCCRPTNRSYHKTASNLSKITNDSLLSVKAYLKKSISNIKGLSKDKKLGPCSCDKSTTITKNVETICVPEGVKIAPCPKREVAPCPKRDTFTGTTTKDSSTQKCECKKCQNFSEDGTCCCSHCLGCLDKSFDTKPDKNNIGTSCHCVNDSVVKGDGDAIKSKGTTDAVNTGSVGTTGTNPAENDKSTKTSENSSTTPDQNITEDEVGKAKVTSGADNAVAVGTTSTNPVEYDKGTKTTENSGNTADQNIPGGEVTEAIVTTDVDNAVTVGKTSTNHAENEESTKTTENSGTTDADDKTDQYSPEQEPTNVNLNPDDPENNGGENESISHDATAYYFLTSPPNIFAQFGLRSRNPFEPYPLNFPRVSMFRLDNSQTFNG